MNSIHVGQKVIAKRQLIEPANECHPGGLLCRKGDELIVKKISDSAHVEHPILVAHEGRKGGFCVSEDEITVVALGQEKTPL